MVSNELITGIVGLCGVALGTCGTLLGSWLTAKSQTSNLQLSIKAENERARVAEKRRIYATYMASLESHYSATIRLGYEKDASPELREHLLDVHDNATIQMRVAETELILIAPLGLGKLANASAEDLLFYGVQAERDLAAELDFPGIKDRLIKGMRVDLGESTPDE